MKEKRLKNGIKEYSYCMIYVALLLVLGVVQLLDWYHGSEDPLWHIFFYIMVIPVISFCFGIYAGDRKEAWIFPVFAGILTALVYIFMANGGFSIDRGAWQMGLLSITAAFAGVVVKKIIIKFVGRK